MKILIINAAGIGDFFELIRWLFLIKKQKPNYIVDLIVCDRVYDYAKNCPYVRQVYCMKTEAESVVFGSYIFKLILGIRQEYYDFIINTFPTYSFFGDVKMYFFIKFISFYSGVKTVGIRREKRGKIYDVNFVLKWGESVCLKYSDVFKSIGIVDEEITDTGKILWYDKTNLEEKYKEIYNRKIVFINPFSNSPKRMISINFWSDVITTIAEGNKECMFAVVRVDAEYLNSLFNQLKPSVRDRFFLVDKIFDDWIFVIERSFVVLSVDSATVHIASLLNKKTFVFIKDDLSDVHRPFYLQNIFYYKDKINLNKILGILK